MAVQLNHTIVATKDKAQAANFMAEMFNLPPPEPFYHFLVVRTANGVSLDFLETKENYDVQHYAFLVSEQEFDEIFDRIKSKELPYWADPRGQKPNEINTNDGGRGVYFRDPSGHHLEILTRPYGSG